MEHARSTQVDDQFLATLLGLESSKIGFYSDVRQKIHELESINHDLHVKKSELQAIFDSISDAVVIYDAHGRVQHHNRIYTELFPSANPLGESCAALFHPESRSHATNCPVEKAIQGESSQISFSKSQGNGGKKSYFDVIATPIKDPVGANRALLFIRDVTDRRSRELQLYQAEKMSSIGVLAAGVAHEINNPMTSMAGYAEALQRRFRDAPELSDDPRLVDFPHYLNIIVREVYRCKGIINSLLDFSRRSDGEFYGVNLNEIITEVIELVHYRVWDTKVTLTKHLSPTLPLIQGDPSALRQVFLNLVLNAIQALKVSGDVRVETEYDTHSAVARIKDTGSGIAPQVLEQIWNPFFTTKDIGKGLGLGLAVTYDIIEKHHGSIEVESKVGEGTEFIVRLPLCQEK